VRAVSLAVACLFVALPAGAQDAIQLRPIDLATVRVIGVTGIETSTGAGRTTGVRRVGANPSMGHGSGVAIGPRLILTARHVVWGMSAWAVVPPGESAPIPARPIYVDLERDLAFVAVDRDLAHYVELPALRTLTMSERVSCSGYPLDLREPNPAAASGEVSRVTRDGLLHLSMAVNPGNSGGPIVDSEGRVIAILSMRGRPEAGVLGLAIAVPLGAILSARERVPDRVPRFEAYERDLARAVALIAVLNDEGLAERRLEVQTMVHRANTERGVTPEHRLIFASLAWNTVIATMEADGAGSVAGLPVSSRSDVASLLRAAVGMARSALVDGPYVRRSFPVARPIAIGRTEPFTTR
jgi:hypothetical protein